MKLKKNKAENLLVVLLGILLFAALNCLMVVSAPSDWTDIHVGAWTAFHRGFEMSGFDPATYIVISHWRPLYAHLRHPLLLLIMWPFNQLNEWLRDEYGINCAIYIAGVIWTLASTVSWFTLYKIFRSIVGLRFLESLLLDLFFFSFAYVMLATFVPDHMMLSMTIILLMLYWSGKAMQKGKSITAWKALLLYFLGTGITTTNGIKIWLIDIVCRWKNQSVFSMLKHSLLYLIPTIIIAAGYYYQEDISVQKERDYQKRIEAKARQNDSLHVAKKTVVADNHVLQRKDKQLVDNPLFEWTDVTIPIMPTVVENIFGEGLQLHSNYLLRDSNIENHRPVIVKYTAWYSYIVEILVVLMFVFGIIAGYRERFLWVCMIPFIFDMIIHLALRFALTDVYIMTAHWAFVIPVAIAYLLKTVKSSSCRCTRLLYPLMLLTIIVLTAYLWIHNNSLITAYIMK